jgi:hypothetical protein
MNIGGNTPSHLPEARSAAPGSPLTPAPQAKEAAASATPGVAPLRRYTHQALDDIQALRALGAARSSSSSIAGFSPAHSQRLSDEYGFSFQRDLAADVRQDASVGDALHAFVDRAKEKEQTLPSQPPSQETLNFATTLEGLFTLLDRDRDGKIEKSELRIAVHNPRLKGDQAAALVALLTLMDSKDGEAYEDGITKKQLQELREGKAPGKLGQNTAAYFVYFKNKLQGQSDQVFVGNPDPRQLEQGQYGTCYFLAALVAKAQQDPEGLKKMIQDNRNGTYTVTFPGHDPIVVEGPTDSEKLFGASSGGNGMWATLLEKAYAQLRAGGKWDPNSDPMEDVEGGSLRTGMKAVTGRSTDVDELLFTFESTTREKIKKALAAGKMVTCSTSISIFSKEVVPDRHVYTVIGYDAASDKVKIRNPWGSGEPNDASGKPKDGVNDGIFEMTITEFDSVFEDICYEQ